MVDFTFLGLVELMRTGGKRELQNEQFLPTVGFEPPILKIGRATFESTDNLFNEVKNDLKMYTIKSDPRCNRI